jgi:hypothetical protein
LIRLALLVIAFGTAGGCGPERLYDGPKRRDQEIARIWDTPRAVLLRADDFPARRTPPFFEYERVHDVLPGRRHLIVALSRDESQPQQAMDVDLAAGTDYSFIVHETASDRTHEWRATLVEYRSGKPVPSAAPKRDAFTSSRASLD